MKTKGCELRQQIFKSAGEIWGYLWINMDIFMGIALSGSCLGKSNFLRETDDP